MTAPAWTPVGNIEGSPGDPGQPGQPGTTSWGGIADKPDTFPPDPHSHPPPDWDDVADKPTEFPSEDHSHSITDVDGLDDALNERAVILKGFSSPADEIGEEGNYFLDQTDGVLYGPKHAESLSPPEWMLGPTATPDGIGNDAAPYSLGVRFKVLVEGKINAVRFWRVGTSTMTTRPVNLWSDAGLLLARADSVGEFGEGWVTATFPAPIDVYANQILRVSYGYGVSSRYPHQTPYPVSLSPNLQVLDGALGASGMEDFPSSLRATHYFADVVFQAAGGSVWSITLSWDGIAGKPTTFPADPHSHPSPDWDDIGDKPTEFPPLPHTHPASGAVFVQQEDPETTDPGITGAAVWYITDAGGNIVGKKVRA